MTYGIGSLFGMAFDGLFDDIPTTREAVGPFWTSTKIPLDSHSSQSLQLIYFFSFLPVLMQNQRARQHSRRHWKASTRRIFFY